ncbi:MAG: hypothetical protein OEW19_03545 [Acidobacteriota bacterium]|nr:hypothetical protein [Acidobacteriota bacterium]
MKPSSSTARRPTVDEWGVYDPKQAGLAALYTRLTAVPDSRSADAARGDATLARSGQDGSRQLGPTLR